MTVTQLAETWSGWQSGMSFCGTSCTWWQVMTWKAQTAGSLASGLYFSRFAYHLKLPAGP